MIDLLWNLIGLIIVIVPVSIFLLALYGYQQWLDVWRHQTTELERHVEVQGLCTCEKGLYGAAETFPPQVGGEDQDEHEPA